MPRNDRIPRNEVLWGQRRSGSVLAVWSDLGAAKVARLLACEVTNPEFSRIPQRKNSKALRRFEPSLSTQRSVCYRRGRERNAFERMVGNSLQTSVVFGWKSRCLSAFF